MFGCLIKFTDAYNEVLPSNPLDLLKEIPKEELLATIVAINSKINPIYSSYIDDSRQTQIDCLRSIFLDNYNPIQYSNCLYFINEYLKTPSNHILFSRVTCLYAIQDILNSDDFAKTAPQYSTYNREQILRYLLCVNSNILLSDKEYATSNYEVLGERFFEFFMFKELPQNQYYHSLNPINFLHKSFSLLQKIEKNDFYGSHFSTYLKNIFNVESLTEFFRFLAYTYFKSYDNKLNLNYINILKENTEYTRILDAFSKRKKFERIEKTDLKIFEFSEIKKNPLFKSNDDINKDVITYLILDNKILLEKTYSLFINDFWFDYLKPNQICNRSDWGSFIGNDFFEPFIEEIFSDAFKNNKKIVFKHTNDLKFKLDGKNEIEYADYYIREKNKIILAEAKSNYLPVVNGYKTVYTKEDFDKLDLERFYKDYGLTQMANKTIREFHKYKHSISDSSFNFENKVELYPTLIVNDFIFSSGYTSMAFKKKFEKLLEAENIAIEDDSHRIHPLTIINVADLQNIKLSLKFRKENIFNLFRHYHSSSSFKAIARTQNTSLGLLTVEHSINKLIKENLVSNKNIDWI